MILITCSCKMAKRQKFQSIGETKINLEDEDKIQPKGQGPNTPQKWNIKYLGPIW